MESHNDGNWMPYSKKDERLKISNSICVSCLTFICKTLSNGGLPFFVVIDFYLTTFPLKIVSADIVAPMHKVRDGLAHSL